jgi:uncharacterized membrane protein YqjE
MGFDELLDKVEYLVQNHIVIAVIFIAAISLLIIYRRKSMFKLLAILAALGVVFYIVTLLGSGTLTGKRQKDRLIHKTESSVGSQTTSQ